jgi:PAS domain S-box-containing protein
VAPLRVLLVEDNSSDAWLCGEILQSRGHDVTVCRDAEEAWAALQAHTFPLVLLDLGLPGEVDGLELCRRVRRTPEGDRPVILVITGRTEPSTLQHVLDAGADDYIRKPVDVALLNVRLAVAERAVARQGERWKTLDELEETSRQLNLLFNNLGDVFFSAQVDPLQLLRVSPASEQVLGRTPDQLMDDPEGGELVLPRAALARVQANLEELSDPRLAGAGVVHLYAVRTPDGEERWVQGTYRPALSADGALLRIDGTLSDVSERQRAQMELAARTREMEALARLSEQALSTGDRRQAVDRALDEIRRATGFPMAILERVDASMDGLFVQAARGMDGREDVLGALIPAASPSYVVLSGGAPRSFTDPRDFTHRIHPALRHPEPRVMLVFPLLAGDEAMGTLTLLHTEPARPDGRLLRLAASLSSALAVHLRRLGDGAPDAS